jgi:PAS domain S-box-containing protein
MTFHAVRYASAQGSIGLRRLFGRSSVAPRVRTLLAALAASGPAPPNDYRGLFEDSPTAMWVHESRTLRILAVNAAALSCYGYTREEFLDLTVRDLHVAGDREAFERGLRGRERHYAGLWRHRLKNGTERTVEVQGTPVSWAGEPAQLVLIDDVTELRQLEDQLRQAQKMDAVGQLAGGIAHDFNNLLTAIQGYAELLLDGLAFDDPRRADASEILRASQRASLLTRQLLAFSRKQILAPRVLHLGDVVADIVPMLSRVLGETICLETSIGAGGSVRVDDGQLEQVIVNLCVNARDAMRDGGRLFIETGEADLDETFVRHHPGSRAGRYAVMTVRDTGHGMDRETAARVFEPFFTTKPKGQGTGLGLATVYGIVKQSGGYISVASEVGRGTTIAVYLPVTVGE